MSVGGRLVFVAYGFVDLVAQHPHFARRVDAEANLIAVYTDYRDGDIVADDNTLSRAAAKDQHNCADRVTINLFGFFFRDAATVERHLGFMLRAHLSLVCRWLGQGA